MAGKIDEKDEAQVEQVPPDPWAVAFAALDKENSDASEKAPDTGEGSGPGDVGDTEGADGGEGAPAAEVDDGMHAEGLPGGPGYPAGEDGGEDEDAGVFDLEVTEEQVTQYRENLLKDIERRTIEDVSNAYIKSGKVRHNEGRLGASISDPDICKRDRDGVPHFYNPETGREFTGDNPRRQAQEWVDDYNKEVSEVFNKTCAEYSKKLLEQEGGKLAVLEFAPKYKALDPVRRSMFDEVIRDYEITDADGDVVAYSCDLDKALAVVNRQVQVIQRRWSAQMTKPKAEPTGPALDTPSTTGAAANGGRPEFKSIAEAMEWEQDRILEQMRQKGRR